jgi:hypothetical protein
MLRALENLIHYSNPNRSKSLYINLDKNKTEGYIGIWSLFEIQYRLWKPYKYFINHKEVDKLKFYSMIPDGYF